MSVYKVELFIGFVLNYMDVILITFVHDFFYYIISQMTDYGLSHINGLM